MAHRIRWTRYFHMALAPLLGAYVYSPALREAPAFAALVQFGVFPAIAALGLWLWLGPRWLARRGPGKV